MNREDTSHSQQHGWYPGKYAGKLASRLKTSSPATGNMTTTTTTTTTTNADHLRKYSWRTVSREGCETLDSTHVSLSSLMKGAPNVASKKTPVVSTPPSKSIVCLGIAGQDMLGYVREYPCPDDKVRTTRSLLAGGGNAANTATAIARLGSHASLVTCLGHDRIGDSLLEELERDGVDTKHVVRRPGSSPFTYVVVDTTHTTRTCIHTPGTSGELVPADVMPSGAAALFEQEEEEEEDHDHQEEQLVLSPTDEIVPFPPPSALMLPSMSPPAPRGEFSSGSGDSQVNEEKCRDRTKLATEDPSRLGCSTEVRNESGKDEAGDEEEGNRREGGRLEAEASFEPSQRSTTMRRRTTTTTMGLLHCDARATTAAVCAAQEANKRGICVSVDAEKPRPGLEDALLPCADIIFTNASFPFLVGRSGVVAAQAGNKSATGGPSEAQADESDGPGGRPVMEVVEAQVNRLFARYPRVRLIVTTLGSRGAVATLRRGSSLKEIASGRLQERLVRTKEGTHNKSARHSKVSSSSSSGAETEWSVEEHQEEEGKDDQNYVDSGDSVDDSADEGLSSYEARCAARRKLENGLITAAEYAKILECSEKLDVAEEDFFQQQQQQEEEEDNGANLNDKERNGSADNAFKRHISNLPVTFEYLPSRWLRVVKENQRHDGDGNTKTRKQLGKVTQGQQEDKPNGRECEALVSDNKKNYRRQFYDAVSVSAWPLMEYGPQITREMGNNGDNTRPPSSQGVVVDSTGAGDAFIGGCLVALTRGEPLEYAVALGSFVACSKLTAHGARAGLPRARSGDIPRALLSL